MTRPTILDRDDVAVVPVEPTEEMIFFGFDGWNGFAKLSNKMCNAFRRMLSASPHSSAWQEVREYVAGLEKERDRFRNKVSARSLSDQHLSDEITAVDAVIDGGFGEGGGSPGEWWYERADELVHEMKRRELEKALTAHNASGPGARNER